MSCPCNAVFERGFGFGPSPMRTRQFFPEQGVQARRVGQIKSGAKRQHIKGWEDGRKRRLRGRGLRRDALRHSLRNRSAVSLVEIAAGVAPRDMAALIRGESMLLKLTISFVPPSRVGLRQNKAPAIRTDRRRRVTFPPCFSGSETVCRLH